MMNESRLLNKSDEYQMSIKLTRKLIIGCSAYSNANYLGAPASPGESCGLGLFVVFLLELFELRNRSV